MNRLRKESWERTVGVVLAGSCLLAGVYLLAAPDPSVDLRADRLTAMAALDGVDPYRPVAELADRFGSDLWWTWIHPRTPGALLLQTPLVLVAEDHLRWISVAMTSVGVTAAATLGMRLRPSRDGLVVIVGVLAGVTTIAVEAVTVGAQSSLVAVLLAFAWWRTRSEDDHLGGVAAGLAVTLKVFPWLLIVLFAWKRRRAATAAVSTLVILNGVGLLFPGVGIRKALDALSSANVSAGLDLNASLSRLVGSGEGFVLLGVVLAAVALAATIAIALRGWAWDRAWFSVLALSLAASPLVWSHYALVLIPAVVWMLARGAGPARLLGVLAVVLLLVPHPHFTAWVAVPFLVVAVAIAGVFRSEEGPSGDAQAAASSRASES